MPLHRRLATTSVVLLIASFIIALATEGKAGSRVWAVSWVWLDRTTFWLGMITAGGAVLSQIVNRS